MRTSCRTIVALTLSLAGLNAEDWPQFRGPTGQGLSKETGLPVHWRADSNILWKAEVPGAGWSSPIVQGGRVFVSTAADNGTRCRVLCFDAESGKALWNTLVFEQVPRRKEGKNSYATPTPAADGERVYAAFNDGSLAAVAMDGSVVWTNREVEFYSRHGLGASPIVHQGLVIMAYDGSNPVTTPGQYPNNTPEERLGWQIPWDRSFLAALDAKTGRRVWTGRRGKSRIAHVTPIVLGQGATAQIISCAGDVIQGFDPKNGERLWTVYSQGEGAVPSPVSGDGLIFTSSGFEKTTLRTVRTGGAGDVTATHVAWEERKGTPTQASPLYVNPFLYTITDAGIAHCLDAATGKIRYAERVGGNFSASPVHAEGRIYYLNEAGETTVLAAGPEFKVLAKNPLGEKCQASMAVAHRRLYIRTEKTLWCIGTKS